jgi:hypothetical protein
VAETSARKEDLFPGGAASRADETLRREETGSPGRGPSPIVGCASIGDLCRTYWLLRAHEDAGEVDEALPSAAAVRAFLLADALLGGDDDGAKDIDAAMAAALAAGHSPTRTDLALLIPAALVSQQAGHHLLNVANDEGLPPAAGTLLAVVAERVRAGTELRGPMLEALRGHHSHEARLAAFRAAAGRWLEAARLKTTDYRPAVHIWIAWLADDGVLGRLIKSLADGTLSTSAAAGAARDWNDADFVQAQIETGDAERRGHLSTLKPI